MTLNLRAFLEDAGLEDFESKLKVVGHPAWHRTLLGTGAAPQSADRDS